MKAVSVAWFFIFMATLTPLLLFCNASVPTDSSFHSQAAAAVSTGPTAIHKSMAAQGGGRGASSSGGGGGSISDRPDTVKKSSGSELSVTNMVTSMMMILCYYHIPVHLF